MASSTLVLPGSLLQSTPSAQKTKVRSEDELLKFFLHGSYDVQRGMVSTATASAATTVESETNETSLCAKEELKAIDEQKSRSRCMFEETYMINISLKQPNAKQIDVRIEKSAVDGQVSTKKLAEDEDEVSSIFDEDDHEELSSVLLNELSSADESARTKLTLADMINKSLTTIPATSVDNLHRISQVNHWFAHQQTEVKTRKISAESLPSKTTEKAHKTPSPPIRQPILTTNIKEDEKLFEYLDYLDTKEERKPAAAATAPPALSSLSLQTQPTKSVPKKTPPSEPAISIIDLEQLCRSLTVHDLKNELIRKKIYELKLLIDQQHQQARSQLLPIKPRRDTQPVLIAMPPVAAERRRTTMNANPSASQPHSNYQTVMANYPTKPVAQRQNPPVSSTRKY